MATKLHTNVLDFQLYEAINTLIWGVQIGFSVTYNQKRPDKCQHFQVYIET